jgi:hypothetical protein
MRLTALLVFPCLLGAAATTAAQVRISGTLACRAEPGAPVPIEDRPGHAFAVTKARCTWPKPIEMAGIASKEGLSVSVDEISGDLTTGRGYHMGTMANGDRFESRFQGKSTARDGKVQTAEGTWTFIDGTGRLQGLVGKGMYRLIGSADGILTYDVDGEYRLR